MFESLISSLFSTVLPGFKKVNPHLPWLLVVAHEADRTGAPIVAQNLAEVLSANYNVVIYSQRGGELLEAYCDACVEVRLPRRLFSRSRRHHLALSALTAERTFRFAILNSAETHLSSLPLANARVPIIALMHEFAAYLGRHDLVRNWFERAQAVVFSSALTRADAFRRIGLPPGTTAMILPQGKCVVPGGTDDRDLNATSSLEKALRPAGSEGAFLVLGAGTIDYRKGVDLFVSLAESVRAEAPEIPWRFVWIGGHLKSSSSGDYRLYIADQIDRCGLSEMISVLPSTSDIETAYRSANVLLLPSRLDPLPNVAIDALAVGLPVLCFDKATGIAELLRSAGLDEACVAPYLDLPQMANRLVALARSPKLRKFVGDRSVRLAQQDLQMERYATALVELGEMVAAAKRR